MSVRLLFAFLVFGLLLTSCASSPVGTAARADTEPTTTVVALTALPPVTTTTATIPPKPPIVLGFAGDTSFTHSMHLYDPLGDIAAELTAPDAMFVNLETTIAEADVGTAVDKKYTFKSPPESVQLLADAGIDAVQLANNHTLDFGRPALVRTLELLDEGGLAHAGAGTDPDAAYAPLYLDIEGWRIGMVALSRVPCDWSVPGENTRPEVAWTCDPFVEDGLAAVTAASESADVVVVMVHWGVEGVSCPQPFQRDLAQRWVAAGADLVVGGHPHVLQGVERIGDAWLINSTGNFAFPSANGATGRSALFEFTIAEGEEPSLQVIPVRVSSGRAAPATGDDAAAILNDLGRWSFGYVFDEAGNAVVTDQAGACG